MFVVSKEKSSDSSCYSFDQGEKWKIPNVSSKYLKFSFYPKPAEVLPVSTQLFSYHYQFDFPFLGTISTESLYHKCRQRYGRHF